MFETGYIKNSKRQQNLDLLMYVIYIAQSRAIFCFPPLKMYRQATLQQPSNVVTLQSEEEFYCTVQYTKFSAAVFLQHVNN
jgi:hypothetical protein